jgi:hypothetical protein
MPQPLAGIPQRAGSWQTPGLQTPLKCLLLLLLLLRLRLRLLRLHLARCRLLDSAEAEKAWT